MDVQLAMSLCALFQSLIQAQNAMLTSDNLSHKRHILIDRLFFFSFVWTVGGICSHDYWSSFDDHARKLGKEFCPDLGLPVEGTVFDYCIHNDLKLDGGNWRTWSEDVPTFQFEASQPYYTMVVPTPDTQRFSSLLESLIAVNKQAFITGVTGTGKTVTITSLITSSRATTPMNEGGMGLAPVMLNFSAQTRSDATQHSIEAKLEKKRKNLLGPTAGKKCIIFVDVSPKPHHVVIDNNFY